MKNLMFLPVLAFSFALHAAGLPPLDEWIGKDAALFESVKHDAFLGNPRNPECPYFNWTSNDRTEARYPGYTNSPEWEFNKNKVPEVKLIFDDKTLERIYISIYNRGDIGKISKSKFDELVENTDKFLTSFTGVDGEEQKSKLTGKAAVLQKVWIASEKAWVLRYSFTGKGKAFQAEYIQLTVQRFDPKDDPRRDLGTSMNKAEVRKGNKLLSGIKRDPDGTVFIDGIPMVDQGQKGYCAVAVAERVMKYFGNEEITQHSLAQIAGTSEKGTTGDGMSSALKRIAAKFGLRFKDRMQVLPDNIKDLEKMVKRYNNFAKKKKKDKIEMVVRDRCVYFADTLASMETDIYRDMRLSEKTDIRKFQSALKECVDKGIPVLWSVTLGIVKEKENPQASGGHLRLLIGYNDKEKKVVFSDTWGAGHEKKLMDLDDAWVITKRTMTLEPRK